MPETGEDDVNIAPVAAAATRPSKTKATPGMLRTLNADARGSSTK